MFAILRNAYLRLCDRIFCSAVQTSDDLKRKILHVEKRAAKIIGDDIVPDYDSIVEKVCRSPFDNIAKDDERPFPDQFVNRDRFVRNVCPLRGH